MGGLFLAVVLASLFVLWPQMNSPQWLKDSRAWLVKYWS